LPSIKDICKAPSVVRAEIRWTLESPKLFAELVDSFFGDKEMPDGVVMVAEYLENVSNEAKKTQ
jgi:hypothetical protein